MCSYTRGVRTEENIGAPLSNQIGSKSRPSQVTDVHRTAGYTPPVVRGCALAEKPHDHRHFSGRTGRPTGNCARPRGRAASLASSSAIDRPIPREVPVTTEILFRHTGSIGDDVRRLTSLSPRAFSPRRGRTVLTANLRYGLRVAEMERQEPVARQF